MDSIIFKCLLLCLLIAEVTSTICICCCPTMGSGTCGQTGVPGCYACTNAKCRSSFTCTQTGSSGLTATCSASLGHYLSFIAFALPLLVYLYNNRGIQS
ncbi:unnamed protein product [Adineta ricciae]|uniref:Uncharacterized protein n=1 Tax=Adineta ricciae TaxID=249248 RepID=A0A815P5R9_ADIRI|nr:unnamed protein product [Adineta ricciae]